MNGSNILHERGEKERERERGRDCHKTIDTKGLISPKVTNFDSNQSFVESCYSTCSLLENSNLYCENCESLVIEKDNTKYVSPHRKRKKLS